MRKPRALVLLSGGLDSILAAKILLEMGVQVKALTFKGYFFDSKLGERAAKELGIKIEVIDISKEHLKIVKNPRYGYGKNMNPCIDCHILMLRVAKKIMRKEKFDFVATGEVLGERPMSQNKKAMNLIEKASGLSGYLLRPLSAKLLRPTEVEKRGLIKRDRLLDIQGRSRKKQIYLAKKLGVRWYPSPAGGCLLTDPEFSKRLRELLERHPKAKKDDIELLKIGRHFWFESDHKNIVKIIVGRNLNEDLKLKQHRKKKDILVELENFPGPATLIRRYKGRISKEAVERAKELTQYYSVKARDKAGVNFKII